MKPKILNAREMQKLSFPDMDIELMEFLPKQKLLKIRVEGAWLDIKSGTRLGKGVLLFSDWEEISVRTFDPNRENWSSEGTSSMHYLRDLCETQFSEDLVYLRGFSEKKSQWTEWKIVRSKIHAEFSNF